MVRGIALGIVVLLAAGAARADDASTCTKAPDHDRALKLEGIIVKMMAIVPSPIAAKTDLTIDKSAPVSVRQALAAVRCDGPALSPKEQADAKALDAKASAWAAAQDKAIAAEEKARAEIVVPLCEAVWGRDQARADIAREKSNPSGVVDLQELHSAGQALQYFQAQIDALKPPYG